MADYKLISADSHVNEVSATWERVRRKYGDRAPEIVWNPRERTRTRSLLKPHLAQRSLPDGDHRFPGPHLRDEHAEIGPGTVCRIGRIM